MRIALQYVSDIDGTPQAVQLSLSEWNRLLKRMKKYEQAIRLKADLSEAFDQVAVLRKSKSTPRTLDEFLDEV